MTFLVCSRLLDFILDNISKNLPKLAFVMSQIILSNEPPLWALEVNRTELLNLTKLELMDSARKGKLAWRQASTTGGTAPSQKVAKSRMLPLISLPKMESTEEMTYS